jgi:hypothetical protein
MSYLRPAVALSLVLVVGVASLEHWLLRPPTSGNLSNHCSATAGNNLHTNSDAHQTFASDACKSMCTIAQHMTCRDVTQSILAKGAYTVILPVK